MVFQNPNSSLNPRQTIEQIISRPLQLAGVKHSEISERVLSLLQRVQLSADYLARYPHQLSGGEKQRVSLARALAGEPELLICDEPTSALDVSVQASILSLLKELKRQEGLSMLFISHDLAVVQQIADQILVMHQGRVVESGSVQDVLQQPQHAYTRALLEARASIDARLKGLTPKACREQYELP